MSKEIVVTYGDSVYWGKRHRYTTPALQIEANFDLNSVNLYNYELTDQIKIGENQVCYIINPITERFIETDIKECEFDFSQIPAHLVHHVRRLILSSFVMMPRGKKKRGITAYLQDEKPTVRNKTPSSPSLMVLVKDTAISVIDYVLYPYCGHNPYIPKIRITKSIFVDGIYIGTIHEQELDKSCLSFPPIYPIPLTPDFKVRGEFQEFRRHFRDQGYPRGVAKRMALEAVSGNIKIRMDEYDELIKKYERKLEVWELNMKNLSTPPSPGQGARLPSGPRETLE